MAGVGGEIDDGLWSQPAVEVIVQEDLGCAADVVASGDGDVPILPAMRIFTTLDEVASFANSEIGTTDWLVIDQERINLFADATGDHQWIHVDEERAKTGPFGATIAHGFLTVSLLPLFNTESFALETRVPGSTTA